MLTWRALLRGWPRPNEQHDASEFLIFMLCAGVRTTPLSQWVSVARRAGAIEIVELGAGIIYLDMTPGVEGGASTLQHVLQAWHEQPCNRPGLQDPARCVQGDETHVALALKRFTWMASEQTFQKDDTPVIIPERCMLPIWELGQVTWVPFDVRAVVIHIGVTPVSGHYRTYLPGPAEALFTEDGQRAKRVQRRDVHNVQTGCYLFLLAKCRPG